MTVPLPKASLLLVDDKPNNLIALQAVLSDEYNLFLAYSGKEALELLEKNEVAVILLDIQMPGMDGFETARRIKLTEKGRNVPIIFITAIFTENPYIKEGYKVGAVDYFAKPFDPEILKLKVGIYASFHQKTALLREKEKRIRQTEDLLKAGQRLSAMLETLPIRAMLSRALDSGRPIRNQAMPIKCFDGISKTLLSSALPLRGIHEDIVGMAVVIQDITEHKKVEDDMEQRILDLISTEA